MKKPIKILLTVSCLVLVLVIARPIAKKIFSKSGDSKQKNSDVQEKIQQLQSLGYLGGYRAPTNEDKDDKFVPQIDRMAPGYTLITSGHAPVAYLIDASGSIVHTWSIPFKEIFPTFHLDPKVRHRDLIHFWRHATLLPNGELLIIFEGVGLVKLDRDSKVIWAKLNGAHHDLQVLTDGTILVLTRKVEMLENQPILCDYATYLSPDGVEKKKFSLVKSILESPFRETLIAQKDLEGDLLHSNSIQQLDATAVTSLHEAKPGDLLISLRNLDAMGIFNPDSEKLVWISKGEYRLQHYPHVDPSGKTLWMFDNLGARKRSRVLQYEWPSMNLIKEIGAKELHTSFLSKSLGVVETLSNGNILIAESEGGRLFEIDSTGEVVWRYTTPYKTGKENKLIATIPHAHRVPEGEVVNWIKR